MTWKSEFDGGLNRTLDLAVTHGPTAYDAAYLELCPRRGLPLARFDAELARAARTEGVTVLI